MWNLGDSGRGSASKRRSQPGPVVQGTQAVAEAERESNATFFTYPPTGFVTPIEHSLIYAMIREPTIYPNDVILQAIADQDFAEFLEVVPDKKTKSMSLAAAGSAVPSMATGSEQEGPQQQQPKEEPVVSYAQLSAILSLAMQKWPEQPLPDQRSVPEGLTQAIIKTVVRYANEHELDRKQEINEVLRPAVERTRDNLGKAMNTKFVLPYIAGAALSIATGNPLPLYLAYSGGMVSYLNDPAVTQEKEHAVKIHQASQRAGNVETTSLMDETDHDD